MKRRNFIQLLSASGFISLAPSCSKAKQQRHWSSIGFNTNLSVTIDSPLSDQEYDHLIKDLDAKLDQVSQRFSLGYPDSELNQLNQHKQLNASPEFAKVIKRCLNYAQETDGVFDISVQPLWEWYSRTSKFQSIDQVLKAISYKHIEVIGNKIILNHPQAKLTLNGMIQGYLTDQLYQVCQQHSIKKALINGGEFRAIGTDANNQMWKIPIRGKNGKKLSSQYLSDGEALAVSAGYGYTFTHTKDNANHIFDPTNQTKTSANTTTLVKAKTAEVADVYATALTLIPVNLHGQYVHHFKSSETL